MEVRPRVPRPVKSVEIFSYFSHQLYISFRGYWSPIIMISKYADVTKYAVIQDSSLRELGPRSEHGWLAQSNDGSAKFIREKVSLIFERLRFRKSHDGCGALVQSILELPYWGYPPMSFVIVIDLLFSAVQRDERRPLRGGIVTADKPQLFTTTPHSLFDKSRYTVWMGLYPRPTTTTRLPKRITFG